MKDGLSIEQTDNVIGLMLTQKQEEIESHARQSYVLCRSLSLHRTGRQNHQDAVNARSERQNQLYRIRHNPSKQITHGVFARDKYIESSLVPLIVHKCIFCRKKQLVQLASSPAALWCRLNEQAGGSRNVILSMRHPKTFVVFKDCQLTHL